MLFAIFLARVYFLNIVYLYVNLLHPAIQYFPAIVIFSCHFLSCYFCIIPALLFSFFLSFFPDIVFCLPVNMQFSVIPFLHFSSFCVFFSYHFLKFKIALLHSVYLAFFVIFHFCHFSSCLYIYIFSLIYIFFLFLF